jgi:nucleoside-diphosphate-sugar epimerase
VQHLLHCGSVWRYGASRKLPIAEDSSCAAEPHDEYGIQKARIADLLKRETADGGLITTSIHPGHIVGPGWQPIGPLGNLDETLWAKLSSGTAIDVPGSGAETLHHVHADDVAQAFERAVENRDAAAGEDFNIVAPTALNVRGYIEIASGWFGRSCEMRSVSWERFRELTTSEHADVSRSHLERSQVFSIEKARTRLGYAPRYEPDAAILESVRWLIEHGRLDVAAPLVPTGDRGHHGRR